ncbi:hypothetical protein B0J18DRAFT_158319 [Chaetomium sp. MPI-SDFR-AT-0129]|nr:hypothetical protein B0J18DRAFT_158319 [Chaetomium sp. MPI-SDFR-AT-0129]
MPSYYTLTEPHPTVAQNSYTHSGRGGLGNFFRAPATTAPSGVPTPSTSTTAASTRRFYSGRGGAGNAHSAGVRPVLSFDEEFARAEVRENKKASGGSAIHVGRGGAGNFIPSSYSNGKSQQAGDDYDGETLARRGSANTDVSSQSTSSSRSLSGFWGRVRSAGR